MKVSWGLLMNRTKPLADLKSTTQIKYLVSERQVLLKSSQLPICSRRREGNQTLYQKSSGDDGVLICMKTSGQYGWKTLDGRINDYYTLFAGKICS